MQNMRPPAHLSFFVLESWFSRVWEESGRAWESLGGVWESLGGVWEESGRSLGEPGRALEEPGKDFVTVDLHVAAQPARPAFSAQLASQHPANRTPGLPWGCHSDAMGDAMGNALGIHICFFFYFLIIIYYIISYLYEQLQGCHGDATVMPWGMPWGMP